MQAEWSPRVDYDTQAYWEGCERQELIIARCRDCSLWLHPPHAVCPECWSDNIGREPVSGDASIYSFTVTPGARRPGHTVAITVWAELAEQERLIIVADLEPCDAASVAIGMPLQLTWGQHGTATIPMFRTGLKQ